MESVREAWTDERLDDLNHRVDDGFKEMRTEFRALLVGTQSEFQAVRAEMGANHRTLVHVAIAGLVTLIVGFGGTVAAVLTQV